LGVLIYGIIQRKEQQCPRKETSECMGANPAEVEARKKVERNVKSLFAYLKAAGESEKHMT